MTRSIDLNADIGEDESESGIARDIALMDVVSSCNIACGAHAGSAETMRAMLSAAKSKGVSAGAHPSYPDREGFGRKSLDISINALRESLQDQIGLIQNIASEVGTELHHLKPHGALYNDAQDREDLAELLVDLTKTEKLPLVGMNGSLLERQATTAKVAYICEAFVDRRYADDCRLVSRSESSAVLASDNDRLEQGLALATGKPISSNSGQLISITAQTLCIHSDSEGALQTARSLRAALERRNITIKAPDRA